MNRTSFIKTGLAAMAGLFVGSKAIAAIAPKSTVKKYGFLHIGQLPAGMSNGDITIIDNQTGKWIRLYKEREDEKQYREYCVWYVDDTNGLIGGTFECYDSGPDNYDRKLLLTRPFYEHRDLSIVIDHAAIERRKAYMLAVARGEVEVPEIKIAHA